MQSAIRATAAGEEEEEWSCAERRGENREERRDEYERQIEV